MCKMYVCQRPNLIHWLYWQTKKLKYIQNIFMPPYSHFELAMWRGPRDRKLHKHRFVEIILHSLYTHLGKDAIFTKDSSSFYYFVWLKIMQVKIYFYLSSGTWLVIHMLSQQIPFCTARIISIKIIFRFSVSHVDANNTIRIELIQ